jgi:hypothetical protein
MAVFFQILVGTKFLYVELTYSYEVHGRLLRILISWLLHRSLRFMRQIAHHNCNVNIFDIISPIPLLYRSLTSLNERELQEMSQAHYEHQINGLHIFKPVLLDDVRESSALVVNKEEGILGSAWRKCDLPTTHIDAASWNDCFIVGARLNYTAHLND